MFYTWAGSVATSLQDMWWGVLAFLPGLIAALVVFVLGLVVAAGLGALVERIFQAVKLDSFLNNIGLSPFFERAGIRLNGARFLGQIVNWFLIVAFLLAVTDILGLTALAEFLKEVLQYIPTIIAAVLVMLASVVLANFLKRVVSASVKSAKLSAADFLGSLTWWAVIVSGLYSALQQLGVDIMLINTLITGLIAMFALAGGLAFGLGGKDYASHLINKLRDMDKK
ncbi:MAG TPA: hypothetical protein VJL32_01990 [Candidatus Paceibacterota bacterium]